MESIKENFLKTYSNLPKKIREEIIVVIDGEPFTWNSAYFEVKNNTETGREILNTLKEIGIYG